METDPPADDLVAAIDHENEVAGMNNDGGKASGEGLNEDGGEASGEEASLPNPCQRGYTTQLDFEILRDASAGTRRGNKNKQHMTSQPAGLLLVFLMPVSRKLLLPLWVTINSYTATRVPQRKI